MLIAITRPIRSRFWSDMMTLQGTAFQAVFHKLENLVLLNLSALRRLPIAIPARHVRVRGTVTSGAYHTHTLIITASYFSVCAY